MVRFTTNLALSPRASAEETEKSTCGAPTVRIMEYRISVAQHLLLALAGQEPVGQAANLCLDSRSAGPSSPWPRLPPYPSLWFLVFSLRFLQNLQENHSKHSPRGCAAPLLLRTYLRSSTDQRRGSRGSSYGGKVQCNSLSERNLRLKGRCAVDDQATFAAVGSDVCVLDDVCRSGVCVGQR
jgi:hypothetical protein